MSVAWTTIVILILLLPGIFFFIGLATYERLSREIIRSSVISEIATAIVVSIILHTVSIVVLSAFGFRLSAFLLPFMNAINGNTTGETLTRISASLLPAVIYLLANTGLGFGCGYVAAFGVVGGKLRFLAKHKWIYDVVDVGRKGGIVTAYVMTTTVESEKVLMYRGRVHELFLSAEGQISYVILKNCARFYMTFTADAPVTSKQLDLFGADQNTRSTWDYLLIEGSKIANILFDPSQQKIVTTNEGEAALRDAVRAVMLQRMNELRRTAADRERK